ncbi:MAG: hypothetical protein J2P54_17100 [Bradyrhizobiaceae bacterium]|nr:hypothetical protein [Bradyrhizobiaceae bacterium]
MIGEAQNSSTHLKLSQLNGPGASTVAAGRSSKLDLSRPQLSIASPVSNAPFSKRMDPHVDADFLAQLVIAFGSITLLDSSARRRKSNSVSDS